MRPPTLRQLDRSPGVHLPANGCDEPAAPQLPRGRQGEVLPDDLLVLRRRRQGVLDRHPVTVRELDRVLACCGTFFWGGAVAVGPCKTGALPAVGAASTQSLCLGS